MSDKFLLRAQRAVPTMVPLLLAWKLWQTYRDRRASLRNERSAFWRNEPWRYPSEAFVSRVQFPMPHVPFSGHDAVWCEQKDDTNRASLWTNNLFFGLENVWCEQKDDSEPTPEQMAEIAEDVAQMGDRFFMKRILKRGETTRVYECSDTLNNKPVAIKIVDCAGNAPSIHCLEREIELVSSFISAGKSDYFVPIHYFDGRGDAFVLAMDLCSGDDLCDKMTEMFTSPSELTCSTAIIRALMLRMFACLECLHSQELAHLDIKPDNFVFSDKTCTPLTLDDISTLKLIDLSGVKPNSEAGRMKEVMTTLHYAAPELLRSQETDLLACDVWAMGVIFYILLTQGSYPLTERDIYGGDIFTDGGIELRKRIDEVEAPPEAKDLLASMMHLSEKDRPTLREMMSHPFFRSKDDVKLPKIRRMRGTFGRDAKVDRRAITYARFRSESTIANLDSSAATKNLGESNIAVKLPPRRRNAVFDASDCEKLVASIQTKQSRPTAERSPKRAMRAEMQKKRRREGSLRSVRKSSLFRSSETPRQSVSVPLRRLTLTDVDIPVRRLSMDHLRKDYVSDGTSQQAESRRGTMFLHRLPQDLVIPDISGSTKSSSSDSDSDSDEDDDDDSDDSTSEVDSDYESDGIPFYFDNPLLVSPWERMAKRESEQHMRDIYENLHKDEDSPE